jgi:cell division septal protein FtsQ
MERDTKIKFFGTGFFIILLIALGYLVYKSNEFKAAEVIEKVDVTGNNLLTGNDYLSFAKLDDKSMLKGITLSAIKSRFEKHPYVSKADVKFVNEKEVKVFLTEKNIYGVIIKNPNPVFITENFEVLPIIHNTKINEIPVLSNVSESSKLKALTRFKTDDILEAFKIIDATRFTNPKMLKNIAEINLRNGGDVLLTFSGLNFPVIFGRGNEAEKAVYLDAALSDYFNGNNLLEQSSYLDLRFNNELYVGRMKKTEL